LSLLYCFSHLSPHQLLSHLRVVRFFVHIASLPPATPPFSTVFRTYRLTNACHIAVLYGFSYISPHQHLPHRRFVRFFVHIASLTTDTSTFCTIFRTYRLTNDRHINVLYGFSYISPHQRLPHTR